ncbi:hypothetical protein [Vibrio parahaemolyticus]|uniref:hypothetical protein n=1 Tax=Vibrio parahaemolyticus TaxID=670 RepID=UPI001782E2EE|nr:hypothetical protein [Vibrio parahaemolyticus]MBD6946521.1 hypothetical protein [Vibrio parahaemolyticus]MBD6960111.1 hypothetical protein [Vibrio parahaemolyticus]MBD6979217.1 hypothetical protein [Vibrio parahaemolyticus]MBD6992316.1 hypothetical protein [Vibrio parahaemolyticus]
MSEILNELQELKKASQEQTAASQAQTAEVAGKMAEIEQRVSDAETEFKEFISGDFDVNVANALSVKIYIDPENGNDANDGSGSDKAIKSSSRLRDLIDRANYEYVTVYVFAETELILMHGIRSSSTITFTKYGSGERPIIRQGAVSYVQLNTLKLRFFDVDVYTYKAVENEIITAPSYQARSLTTSVTQLTLQNCNLTVCDNHVFHIHNSGSGGYFYPNVISSYAANIVAEPSAVGVSGALKRIYEFFTGKSPFPAVDFFGGATVFETNGVHSSSLDFLGVSSTFLRTNFTLS